MNRLFLTAFVLQCLPIALRADAVAYGGPHEIIAKEGILTFSHFHNWDAPQVEQLFSDLIRHERFFSAANNFSFVELREGKTVLFRSPSSALTKLWISSDGQYFVGLSSIMLRNPYQLVIWRRDGAVVHREHISSEVAKLSLEQRQEFAKRFPEAERFLSKRYFVYGDSTYLDYRILGVPNNIGSAAWTHLDRLRVPHPYADDFSESVTNIVEWFDRRNPDLKLLRKGHELSVSWRSPTGKRVTIIVRE